MDQSLAYLHEVLSNYTDQIDAARALDEQLSENQYRSEGEFVRSLEEEDGRMLSEILQKEIHHANQAGDFERVYQLNEIYELLF
ncbi:sporulation protein [Salirhabdus sp. Marseille-P4669]|uniref:sporulation protein n=1 Tax=Salirhabdus sp. Marseille-P4669 TaxID=2042310 RepID=UPI000C7D7119|nr:sporulation protein [Salirhabdus sp. Marseille-P4669]